MVDKTGLEQPHGLWLNYSTHDYGKVSPTLPTTSLYPRCHPTSFSRTTTSVPTKALCRHCTHPHGASTGRAGTMIFRRSRSGFQPTMRRSCRQLIDKIHKQKKRSFSLHSRRMLLSMPPSGQTSVYYPECSQCVPVRHPTVRYQTRQRYFPRAPASSRP